MSLLLIALLQLSLLFPNVISTCSTTSNVEITFYGYPDGPSDTTSFGCSGTQQIADGTAGGKSWLTLPPLSKALPSCLFPSLTVYSSQGDGSYANPETFATALNNPSFTPCDIIYIPLFQKYFQYMDHCEECMELYPSTTRIDLWIGSDVNGGSAQITCEQDFGLKTGQMIVHDPPNNLKVNGGQLWDNDSGTCGNVDLVFPNYSTNEADMCGGGSSSSGSSPAESPISSAPLPAPTSSTPTAVPSSMVSEKEEVAQAVNVKADVVHPAASSPAPSTLVTVVSSTTVPTTSASPSTSASAAPSGSDADCGVTAEWPNAWLGHCVGAPCKEFNDCSGELICQGWPNSVCTSPR